MSKKDAMNKFKLEVAQELGYINSPNESEYQRSLENKKYEVAKEKNITLQQGYNGDLQAKDAGKVGGNLGGKIGGQMVQKMIEQAEKNLITDYL